MRCFLTTGVSQNADSATQPEIVLENLVYREILDKMATLLKS